MLAVGVLGLLGCGGAPGTVRNGEDRLQGKGPLLAVYPVENLSARPAPLENIRQLLIEKLTSVGVGVLDDVTLERALAKHRVRWTGGVERGFARALSQEAGVEGILIASLELYDESVPPRIALFARLVSTGTNPSIRWMDSAGSAGDDSPGILGLGLITDPRDLLERAANHLARSLSRHLADAGVRGAARPPARRFNPKIAYRAETLDPSRTHSVAVVPFFNKTGRKYAGQIMALHMIRNLITVPGLEVVEPGVVREELLRFRIIMSDGISLPQTETILGAVNAELVLNGEVLEYQERRWVGGAPVVDFGILFIERKTARIVYSSYSYNAGDDGVFFFDAGLVKTAHAMASRMARAIGAGMLVGAPTARVPQDQAGPRDRRR